MSDDPVPTVQEILDASEAVARNSPFSALIRKEAHDEMEEPSSPAHPTGTSLSDLLVAGMGQAMNPHSTAFASGVAETLKNAAAQLKISAAANHGKPDAESQQQFRAAAEAYGSALNAKTALPEELIAKVARIARDRDGATMTPQGIKDLLTQMSSEDFNESTGAKTELTNALQAGIDAVREKEAAPLLSGEMADAVVTIEKYAPTPQVKEGIEHFLSKQYIREHGKGDAAELITKTIENEISDGKVSGNDLQAYINSVAAVSGLDHASVLTISTDIMSAKLPGDLGESYQKKLAADLKVLRDHIQDTLPVPDGSNLTPAASPKATPQTVRSGPE